MSTVTRKQACDIDYIQFGSGSRPFVILPGLSIGSVLDSADVIAEAYDVFTDRYTVYLIDRRNHPAEPYTIDQMADDTAAMMREEGLSGVDLFGASQGGMIGLAMALRHPDLIGRLVLGSSVARVGEYSEEILKVWLDLAARREGVRLLDEFGVRIYPPEVYENFKEGLRMIGRRVTADELDRFILLASAAKGFDLTGKLDRIRCPVFAIGSRDDQVFGPDALRDFEKELGGRPDFKSYYYDGYGHAAFDTAPDYKERILEFLES